MKKVHGSQFTVHGELIERALRQAQGDRTLIVMINAALEPGFSGCWGFMGEEETAPSRKGLQKVTL